MLQSTVCLRRHYENISKNKNTCLSSKFVLKGAVTPEINRVKAKKADPNLKRSIGWNKYTMQQFVLRQRTKHWEDNIVRWRFICFGKLFVSIEYCHSSVVKVQGLWTEGHEFESPWGFVHIIWIKLFWIYFFLSKMDTFWPVKLTYFLSVMLTSNFLLFCKIF